MHYSTWMSLTLVWVGFIGVRRFEVCVHVYVCMCVHVCVCVYGGGGGG